MGRWRPTYEIRRRRAFVYSDATSAEREVLSFLKPRLV